MSDGSVDLRSLKKVDELMMLLQQQPLSKADLSDRLQLDAEQVRRAELRHYIVLTSSVVNV